jgi:hypothetical protein
MADGDIDSQIFEPTSRLQDSPVPVWLGLNAVAMFGRLTFRGEKMLKRGNQKSTTRAGNHMLTTFQRFDSCCHTQNFPWLRWHSAALVLLACFAGCQSKRGVSDPHADRVATQAQANEPVGSVPSSTTTSARAASPGDDVARWLPLDKVFVATSISAVSNNRCAVSSAGQVACWGDLTNRQSGPVEIKAGLTTPRVLAGIEGAIAVTTNWFYVCVAQRIDAGPGRCFAMKDLGFKVPQFPSPPVELGPGTGSGVCARMIDGNVGCIDAHGKYQQVAGIANATLLACADDMNTTCCAATATGLLCFGNKNEQIGMTVDSATIAKPLSNKLPKITALALDRSGACARTTTGGAECWGNGAKLSRPSGVKAVGATNDGMCLVLDGGTLACVDNAPNASHVVQIDNTCTLHDDGSMRCWGDNSNGELGDGAISASATPVRVPGLDDAIDLQVAHTNACAVKRDKSLHCWGPDAVAEFADFGSVNGPLVPAQYISGCRIDGASVKCSMRDYVSVQSSSLTPNRGPLKSAAMHRDGSVCVVERSGAVMCLHGMADNGLDVKWRPLAAPGAVDELQPLGVGFCARQRDGHVSCFVDHRYDTDEDYLEKAPASPKLVLVPGLAHVVQLATGQSDACAITAAGDVLCWDADRQSKLVAMPTLHGATALAGNHLHMCALVNGEAWCWGENMFGQLGDGTSTEMLERVAVPVRAALPAKAIKLGVGRDSTCALLSTGQVWCWGANDKGQLGTGHRQRSEAPLRVVGIGPK